MPQRHLPGLLALLVAVTACAADPPAPPPTDAAPSLRPAGDDALGVRDGATSPRTTTSLGGNRFVDAELLPDREIVTFAGPELATHLLHAPVDGGDLLVALGPGPAAWLVADDGEVRMLGDQALAALGPGEPRGRPSLQAVRGRWRVELGSDGGGDGRWVVDDHVVEANAAGALVVDDRTVVEGLLPDARFAVRDGVLAVLAGPTTRYRHAVLGDAVEADAVVLVDLATGEVRRRVSVGPDEVVEGLGVLLADLDGTPAALVTLSGPADGARQVGLGLDDGRWDGPAIGQGNRWRHLLGVADGRVHEIVTPHLARVWQVLDPVGEQLVVGTSTQRTLASHTIGSRDLEQSLLVRLDGGAPGALGPADDDPGVLRVIDSDGAVVTDVPLGGLPTSNVVGWVGADGTARIALAVPGRLVLLGQP